MAVCGESCSTWGKPRRYTFYRHAATCPACLRAIEAPTGEPTPEAAARAFLGRTSKFSPELSEAIGLIVRLVNETVRLEQEIRDERARGRGALDSDHAVALLQDLLLRTQRLIARGPWSPIDDDTPRDRLIEVFAPGREGLNDLVCLCQWHPDAGYCVDELREPTHWREHEPPR